MFPAGFFRLFGLATGHLPGSLSLRKSSLSGPVVRPGNVTRRSRSRGKSGGGVADGGLDRGRWSAKTVGSWFPAVRIRYRLTIGFCGELIRGGRSQPRARPGSAPARLRGELHECSLDSRYDASSGFLCAPGEGRRRGGVSPRNGLAAPLAVSGGPSRLGAQHRHSRRRPAGADAVPVSPRELTGNAAPQCARRAPAGDSLRQHAAGSGRNHCRSEFAAGGGQHRRRHRGIGATECREGHRAHRRGD